MTDSPPEIKRIFESAVNQHRAGNLDAAQRGYQSILEREPTNIDALHMLGMVAHQKGNHKQALELIGRALRDRPPGAAAIFTNLGCVYTALGQPDNAIEVLRKAISMAPTMALAYNNLGNAYRAKGQNKKALNAYHQAIRLNPSLADTYANIGAILHNMNQLERAADYFRNALALNPEHGSARHMLASLTGEKSPCAPMEHIRQLFDDYSNRFDDHLTRQLGYTMPQLVKREIDNIVGVGYTFRNVIDLGCGTGLSGVEFRSMSRRLTGIDVSQRMVEQARARHLYDILRAEDILAYLGSVREEYDFFICTDVFPYVGEIRPLFDAVRIRAEPGAYFVFSTESTSQNDYVLRKTGRYAHSRSYIRKSAREASFSVAAMRTENLRKHRGGWLKGDLVVLRNESMP
jgi:predicted TPR repeat methyltransferase